MNDSSIGDTFVANLVQVVTAWGYDGVDLDWEYPVSGGLSSNTYRPEDKHNYTLLVEEIRRQFNTADALDGKHRLISIAAPAGYDKIVNLEPAALANSLDFMNLMTYDYHGSWENTTNHQAALYGNPADPSSQGAKYTIAATVDAYLAAGVAPDGAELRSHWLAHVDAIFKEATLTMPPADAWMQSGGKQGRHSEHLGYVLAEMQFLQRAYPGATW